MKRPTYLLISILAGAASGCVVQDAGSATEGSSTATTTTGDPEPDPEPEPEPDPSETEGGADETGTHTTAPGFVPDEDFGIGCECDPFSQDCPEGEKCVPYSSTDGWFDANKCVPVSDDQGPGDPCVLDGTVLATDNCDASSFCFDLIPVEDDQFKGTCRAFCEGTADDPQCEGEGVCLIAWEGSTNLCMPSCDPLMQDCPLGNACHFMGGEGGNFACTVPHAGGEAGDACVFVNDCNAGLVCLDGALVEGCESGGCCTSYCTVGAEPDPCAATPNHSCVPFFEGEVPGFESLGVCIDVGGLP